VKKLAAGDERVGKAHALTGNIIDRIIREDLFEKISNNTFTLPYLHPVT
jgi:sigma54-dependent transcription regulator